MNQDIIMVAQLFSIVIAACGTPGLTFWVMKKMNRESLSQIKENCAKCKLQIDEKFSDLDGTLHEAVGRQLVLREKLPIDYVRRDEFLRHADGKP